MDWSIDNGWFIISLVSIIVGTVYSVLKIIDLIRKWRHEKKALKRMGPKISFVNNRARFSICENNLCVFKLKFEIRNDGDYDTSVYITAYDIWTVQNTQDYSYNETFHPPKEVAVPKLKSSGSHILVKLPQAAKEWSKAFVVYHYKYVNINGGFTEGKTMKLEVMRDDPKK